MKAKKYVECIFSEGNAITVGKIYPFDPVIDNNGRKRYHPMDGGIFKYKPSTREAYLKQQNKPITKNQSEMKSDKWCINRRKLSPAQCKVVNKWFNETADEPKFKGETGKLHYPAKYGAYYFDGTQPGYTEYTFAEFEKHVLGKAATRVAYSVPVPEYVEIISGKDGQNYNHWLGDHDRVNDHFNREFRIHKVVEQCVYHGEKVCLLVDPKGNYSSFNKSALKPSTKEVYDKQNVPAFVLPDKWCIARITDNYSIINSWAIKNSSEIFNNKNGWVYCINGVASTLEKGETYVKITTEQFKQYVLTQKPIETMKAKAQSFQINGSPELLEAIGKRLKSVGYDISRFGTTYDSISHNRNGEYRSQSKGDFAQLFNECATLNTKVEKIFTLPQDYDAAIAFAQAQLDDKLWTVPEVKMPFGSTIFTVNKEKGTIKCTEGTITKAEIKSVLDWKTNGPSLLGYKAQINSRDVVITFGCKSGTVAEALAIYNAL